MQALAHTVLMVALASYFWLKATAGLAVAQTTEPQAAPKEQAAADQPAVAQPRVSAEQQAAAEKLGLPVVITNSIGMKLVLIPAGEFPMGTAESQAERLGFVGRQSNMRSEHPQHRVSLTRTVYLSIYEVTQEQFACLSRLSRDRPDGT